MDKHETIKMVEMQIKFCVDYIKHTVNSLPNLHSEHPALPLMLKSIKRLLKQKDLLVELLSALKQN
ncbi:hypothetical protein BH11PLA2_BH11PLA2_09310 [soil metagenome]